MRSQQPLTGQSLAGRPRYQQTRFQQRVAQAGDGLVRWATNPWRRFSLLLIVLLGAFVVGNGVGAIGGALSMVDQVWAFGCVLLIETAARLRGRLRQRPDRLGLQLLDMARMGLLYGLIVDAFKLL
ncbi:MAG: DUF565 domain-containing protein [Cyanobium sp.]